MSTEDVDVDHKDTHLDDNEDESNKSCRMYEAKYPSADDIIVVQVKTISDMGAYVSLLEYGGIEGMIMSSELTRRRIRSIHKLIRVGRQEVVAVVRVDQEKGYIDLSKRRVTPEDIPKAEEKFNKSKQVHSIMRHVAETCKVPLIQLYQEFGWDLYKKFGHAYDAFKIAVTNPEQVLASYTLREDVKASLLKNIKRRLTPQPIKIRADLEVTCFAYEGIDAIKDALRAGESLSLEDMPIKIKLVAPPLYVMMTTSMNKEKGIQALHDAIAKMKTTIKAKQGDVNVKVEPRAVTERDDKLLNQLMEKLEKQNQEVAGDDDNEDD